jgi:periplasmic protein TonB
MRMNSHTLKTVISHRFMHAMAIATAAMVLATACRSPASTTPPPATGTASTPGARGYGSVMDYRQAAGNAIYAANTQIRGTGTLPALLRAIVVLELEVDGSGRLAVARIKRGGADASFNSVALDTIRRTSLPAPSRNLLNRRGTVEYLETWFFDSEGKFQLMAFNPPQSNR